jgi:alanine racemase
MEPSFAKRPTVATVDLSALRSNFRASREFIGKSVKYMAVVKADAYGHGAVECSRALEQEKVDWLAVALPEEAIELRDAGIMLPILSLGGCWPGQERELLEYNITPVISDLASAQRLDRAAVGHTPFLVHIKIDTGMGRLGRRWNESAQFAAELASLPNIVVDGLMTHFAVADKLDQTDFTDQQIDRFNESVEIFHNHGHSPTFIDLANSPGAVVHPRSRAMMVRLGGILFGLGGDVLPGGVDKPELRPVMRLESTSSLIKDIEPGDSVGYGRTFIATRPTRIAAVPIGYHDGYPRALSNRSHVIIRGSKAPVVGRISMDWTMFDVTDIPQASVGDNVTLIGTDGGLQVLAEDLAGICDTISYEITCGISSRVPRRYIED